MELATTLLRHSRQLRVVTRGSLLDYSAVRASLKWITQALQGCPSHFTHLLSHTEALEKVMSLSSGLGLVEIWSGFLGNRQMEFSHPKLAQLDTKACALQDDIGEQLDIHVFE